MKQFKTKMECVTKEITQDTVPKQESKNMEKVSGFHQ